MKRFRHFLFALALIGLSATGAVNAQTWNIGAGLDRFFVTATFSGETLVIVGTGVMSDFTSEGAPWYSVRNSITTLVIQSGVTSIGDNAFNECTQIKGNLTIPNTITSIGDNAFYHCLNISGALAIPNSVTSIGYIAFAGGNQLTSVSIPGSVTSIGSSAFGDASKLVSINVDAANPSYSSADGVLFNKAKTTLIKYPPAKSGDYSIPGSVTGLEDYSFSQSGITSVTIPASVTQIDSYAFRYCKLTSITCQNPNPATITLGAEVFQGVNPITCVLKVPTAAAVAAYRAAAQWKDFANIESLAGVALSITTASLPDGKTGEAYTARLEATEVRATWSISAGSFPPGLTLSDRTGAITGTPTTAGKYNFTVKATFGVSRNEETATKPFSITIAAGNTWQIGSPNAADLIATLSGTTLTVTGTGDMVNFDYNGAPWYDQRANIKTLVLPSGMTSIGHYAFTDLSALTGTLNLPGTLKSIGAYAFFKCTGFTSLTLPNSVTSIGIGTFAFCSGLTGNLTLPNSLTTIGFYAFSDCNGFTGSLTIPNSVTSIGIGTFAFCSGLTGNLTLPNSLTTIGFYAFSDCNGFTGSLTIPNSVKSIGEKAFYNCSGLTSISAYNPNPSAITLGNNVFQNVNKNTCILNVPSGSKAAYAAADQWKEFIDIRDGSVAVTGVTLSPASLSGTVGGTGTLTATVNPAGATNKNVTWSTSNAAVATVSNGTVSYKAAGTAVITVITVDGNKTATANVTVTATVVPTTTPPTITTASLPTGRANEAYSATLTATGDAPISWSISAGTLPPGLTLNATTGVIFGTPTQKGTYTFTVKAANGVSPDATKALTLLIDAAVANETVAKASPLKAYTENGTLHVSGLVAGKPWSVYGMTGVLIYQTIAVGDAETVRGISLSPGIYVVRSADRTVKVVAN